MQKRPVSFSIIHTIPGVLARAGVISTSHGAVDTPAFVAVATKATVKGVPHKVLKDLGVRIIIANAYHLFLSGLEAIDCAGGVGSFMGWDGPTMTDSGGFQIFSLGAGFGKKISKISAPQVARLKEDLVLYDDDVASSHGKLAIVDQDGVTFTSHLDGSLHRFTPERSIEIQHRLGADIIFAFDECTAPDADYENQKEALERTRSLALRSLAAHRQDTNKNAAQGIYGIVQGGRFPELRMQSARELAGMDVDGYGIGGSFSKQDILGILEKVAKELPPEKPRHLLGIGEPEDIFIAVNAGMDTFDCVLPTRNGRNGTLYTRLGKTNITNIRYQDDYSAVDGGCGCSVCQNYSRAYLSHLFRSHEMLGPVLASMHNLYFLTDLTRRIRASILEDRYSQFQSDFLGRYLKKG